MADDTERHVGEIKIDRLADLCSRLKVAEADESQFPNAGSDDSRRQSPGVKSRGKALPGETKKQRLARQHDEEQEAADIAAMRRQAAQQAEWRERDRLKHKCERRQDFDNHSEYCRQTAQRADARQQELHNLKEQGKQESSEQRTEQEMQDRQLREKLEKRKGERRKRWERESRHNHVQRGRVYRQRSKSEKQVFRETEGLKGMAEEWLTQSETELPNEDPVFEKKRRQQGESSEWWEEKVRQQQTYSDDEERARSDEEEWTQSDEEERAQTDEEQWTQSDEEEWREETLREERKQRRKEWAQHEEQQEPVWELSPEYWQARMKADKKQQRRDKATREKFFRATGKYMGWWETHADNSDSGGESSGEEEYSSSKAQGSWGKRGYSSSRKQSSWGESGYSSSQKQGSWGNSSHSGSQKQGSWSNSSHSGSQNQGSWRQSNYSSSSNQHPRQDPPPPTPPPRPHSSSPPLSASQAKRIYQNWSASCTSLNDPTSLTHFPSPPSSHCHQSNCLRGDHLDACHHDLERMLRGSGEYSREFLRRWWVRFHPDKFSACAEGVRGGMEGRGKDMFLMLGRLMEVERWGGR
ncbi:hypothetical protein MMC12_005260 [Toensbergia leucococca]|nr:hypothetical protein [Toensbergia leucococca]